MILNLNQVKENEDGQLELMVDHIMNMAQAAGLNAENTTVIQEVGEKCKSFESGDP